MKKALYKITNMINGKMYIGQSNDPERRFKQHRYHANNSTEKCPLYLAMRKYGLDNFRFDIIEWSDQYNEREQELIQEYNTITPNGYNILSGGEDPPVHYGEEHPKNVVSEAQIDIIIKELKKNDLTEPEIGALFDPPLNQPLINNINRGITHRRVNEDYPIRKHCIYHLKEEDVEDIKWLIIHTSYPFSQIAEFYHVNTSTIKHINSGRNYHTDNSDYPLRKQRGTKQLEPVETILAKRSTKTIDTSLEMGVRA